MDGHINANEMIRTTVDIPAPVYRKLKEQAPQQGCSVSDLLLSGIDRVLCRSSATQGQTD
jgi:hypothetical protein